MKNLTPETKALAQQLTKEFTDKGLIIEAGWHAFRVLTIPKDAPPVQLVETRNAFFAGAQHLYASMMSVLEPGEEPTDNDLRRMDAIHKELEAYLNILKARVEAHVKNQ